MFVFFYQGRESSCRDEALDQNNINLLPTSLGAKTKPRMLKITLKFPFTFRVTVQYQIIDARKYYISTVILAL